MNVKCLCAPAAVSRIRQMAGLDAAAKVGMIEVEFRELPYFLVTRSRELWSDDQGDINAVRAIAATEFGLVVDAASGDARSDDKEPRQRTVIPWANIISITVHE